MFTRMTASLSLLFVAACGAPIEPDPTTDEPPVTGCTPTAEVCDGVDNDCDGTIDEDPEDGGTFFADVDGDSFGDPAATVVACAPPAGFVHDAGDCDDTLDSVNPLASEVCDGIDNDCDDAVDDDAVDLLTFFADVDGDGFGDADVTTRACAVPAGFAADDTDCDDARDDVNPGADEICDEIDHDCDGAPEDGAVDAATFFADADGDGFGDDTVSVVACASPADFVPDGGDCDDVAPLVNPGALEVCDGIDNDCDAGTPDAGTATLFTEAGPVDLTATLTGTAGAPASAVLDTAGRLAVCEGTWFVHLDVQADVDLDGVTGSATTLLDGGGLGTVLTYAAGVEASLTGLTIQNGLGDVSDDDCNAGGVCVRNATLTGNDLVLTQNESTSGGGALAMAGGRVTLTDAHLFTNTAARGGAIHVRPNGVLVLTDATLADNQADEGGALFQLGGGSRTTLERVLVEANLAGSGGGVVADNGGFTFRDVTFAGNEATGGGGALQVRRANLGVTIEDCLFEGNTAAKGGAIQITSQSTRTTTMTCDPNAVAGVWGNVALQATSAAVHVEGGTFAVDGCDFEDPTLWIGNVPADIRAGDDQLSGLGQDVVIECTTAGCIEP